MCRLSGQVARQQKDISILHVPALVVTVTIKFVQDTGISDIVIVGGNVHRNVFWKYGVAHHQQVLAGVQITVGQEELNPGVGGIGNDQKTVAVHVQAQGIVESAGCGAGKTKFLHQLAIGSKPRESTGHAD